MRLGSRGLATRRHRRGRYCGGLFHRQLLQLGQAQLGTQLFTVAGHAVGQGGAVSQLHAWAIGFQHPRQLGELRLQQARPDEVGEAIDRQREDCENLARFRRWEVVETYVDQSKSATDRTKVRPAYDQMVADYKAGAFDAIICYDLDRFTRQPRQPSGAKRTRLSVRRSGVKPP